MVVVSGGCGDSDCGGGDSDGTGDDDGDGPEYSTTTRSTGPD